MLSKTSATILKAALNEKKQQALALDAKFDFTPDSESLRKLRTDTAYQEGRYLGAKDTDLRNSSGISQEFARNSTGISNSQEFLKKTGKTPTLDLSHIAKSDPAEKKLADLANTIDKLSASADSDGMAFSPTKLQTALGMGYERIKPVFELKQQEGKISMTKPFKIIHTGGA